MEFFLYFIAISVTLYAVYFVVYLKLGIKYQTKRQFPLLNKGVENKTGSLTDNFSVTNFDIHKGSVESFFFGDSSTRPAIIVVHGNEGLIDSNIDLAKALVSIGCHVLLVEYPGYGRSSGTPNEKSFLNLLTQAFDFLKRKNEVSKIIVYGSSMGGCVTANLLKNRTPDALILRSTFINFGDLISKTAFLPRIAVKNGFFNEKLIREYSGKILIMHGMNDNVVKYDNAIKLYNASKYPVFIKYEGGHESPADNEVVKQTKLFLDKYIIEKS